jgi:hypothetical protein
MRWAVLKFVLAEEPTRMAVKDVRHEQDFD